MRQIEDLLWTATRTRGGGRYKSQGGNWHQAVVQSRSLIKWSMPQTWMDTVQDKTGPGLRDGEKFPTKDNNNLKTNIMHNMWFHCVSSIAKSCFQCTKRRLIRTSTCDVNRRNKGHLMPRDFRTLLCYSLFVFVILKLSPKYQKNKIKKTSKLTWRILVGRLPIKEEITKLLYKINNLRWRIGSK